METEELDFFNVFEWSSTEYDLKTFHQDYKKQFPCLVRITSGYAGAAEQQMNEIGVDEMYWIFGVHKQKRIVAKNKNDLYISIPLENKFKFQTIDRKAPRSPPGPSISLQQLIQPGKCFKGEQIIFEDDQEVSFLLGADAGSRTHFGRMELLDSYNEKYLLANSVIENDLYGVVLGIPVYMPVQLIVAVGLLNHPVEHFTAWLDQLNEVGRSFDLRTIEPCKEILLFDEAPASDYEYLEPLTKLHITKSGNLKKEDGRDEPAPDHHRIETETRVRNPKSSMPSRTEDDATELEKDEATGSEDEDDSYENIEELVKQRKTKKVQSAIKAPPPRVPPKKHSTAEAPPKVRQNVAPANNKTRLVGKATSIPPGSATPGSNYSGKSPPPGSATPGSSLSGKSPPPGSATPGSSSSGKSHPPSSATPGSSLSGKSPPPSSATPGSSLSGKSPPPSSATPGSSSSGKSPLGGFGELYLKMKNSKKGTNVQKVLPMQADPSPFERPGIVKNESVVKPSTSPLKEPAHPKPKPVIEPVIPYTISRKIESVDPRSISNPVECSSEDSAKSSSVNKDSSGWKDPNDLSPMDINIANLSIEEVHQCVKMIGIKEEKADVLKDANVDGTLLLNLDVDMLVNDFGFRTFDAKKLMVFAKDGWRPKTNR